MKGSSKVRDCSHNNVTLSGPVAPEGIGFRYAVQSRCRYSEMRLSQYNKALAEFRCPLVISKEVAIRHNLGEDSRVAATISAHRLATLRIELIPPRQLPGSG